MTAVSDVAPCRLVIRCLLERSGDQWSAFTLEFGLAVQGDSAEEVRRKLEHMIQSYLLDALIGQDREHAHELLRRNATWGVYLRYYWASICSTLAGVFHQSEHGGGIVYREPIPLKPCTA